jgi:RNA polymerase sigma-70 factor (ECF subfamily)
MKLRDKQARTPAEIREEMTIALEEDAGPASHLEKDRQLDLMTDCLQELNKEQKQCVTLFYLEKRSYNEIADLTGFSLMQVKSYIQNGKRNLKILLERKLNQS